MTNTNEPTSPLRLLSADEIVGMHWCNSMTEAQRAKALELTGWKLGGT